MSTVKKAKTAASKTTKTVASKPTKKALIVWGGWDGHTPKPCADLFAPWLESKGFQVVVSDTLDAYADKDQMKDVNLIVPIWTMGELKKEQWAGLNEAVLNGAGLAGWHGGMCDSFRTHTSYQFMTGGQWVAHPGNIIPHQINITAPDDPIVKGLKDFEMVSEQYYMHTDPSNEALATTTFSGKHGNCPWIKGTVMPYVWKRTYGKGRVFYTALGHVAADFKVPEAMEIVKRGMQWAARERIKPEYTSA
ncbi:MAG TPA: hypothetical protein DCS43_10785 [Verrucomicrobia bacterium]|nr:hypothetical protein [Verrucomicrobiota bacterium]